MENTLGTTLMHREALIRLHLSLLAWSKHQPTKHGKKKLKDDNNANSSNGNYPKIGHFELFFAQIIDG